MDCVVSQVRVTLRGSDDFYVDHVSRSMGVDVVQNVDVASGSGSTVRFWIEPVSVGSIPIEVQAVGGNAGDALRRNIIVKVTNIFYFKDYRKS